MVIFQLIFDVGILLWVYYDKTLAEFPNEYLCDTYTAELDIVFNVP